MPMLAAVTILYATLEREREVAERGMERRAGVADIGLSGERKICLSRSASLTCSVHEMLTIVTDVFTVSVCRSVGHAI